MKQYDEDKFIIKDKSGNNIEFYKLLTFKSNITNKSYIVYKDENDNIYSSILKNTDNNIVLEKIIDEIDINEVNKALLKVKINLELLKESKEGSIID